MYKIIIADDHPVVRAGLTSILARENDLKVGGEAPNSQELLMLIRKQDWDLVILDINMPDSSGFELIKDIRRVRPKLPVFVVSMYQEEVYGPRALKAGASGYVSKKIPPDILVKAIRTILQGGKYISPVLTTRLVDELQTGDKPAHHVLSDREFEVMCKMTAGKTTSEIAAELFLSVKTISTYRSRILKKMRIRTNASLIRYALENHLID
ncbi:MAG: response regulator transcription factor [Planctomycetes bacterium]|nr:response regulator transcription factor [Planctomycetota bacterium]